MLFSILIPVYNVEKYLKACVMSVMIQDPQDFEIIMCDDGSTDQSFAICEECAARYPNTIKLLRNSQNEGLLLTRRHLFAAASGQYILCLDADDQLEPNALPVLRECVTRTGADMILFNARCIDMDQAETQMKPALKENTLYRGEDKKLCYEAIFQNTNLNNLFIKVFRRELLDLTTDYTPWRALCIGEDLFQSYPLFDRAASIFYLDQSLYCYYKRAGSLTTAPQPHFYEMRKMLWERENHYIEAWDLSRDVLKRISLTRCNEVINYTIKTASTQPFASFACKADQIRQDAFFSTSWKNARVSGRYHLYGRLILSGRLRLLYLLGNAETFAVKRLRKRERAKRRLRTEINP